MDPRPPLDRDQTPSPGSFSHLPLLSSSLKVATVANGSNVNESSATPRPLVVGNPTLQTPSVSLPAETSVSSSHRLTHSVAVAMLEGRPHPTNGRRMSISDPPALRSLPIRNRLRRNTCVGPAPLPEQQLSGEAADVSPGSLLNTHNHRLAYSQLRYQAGTQTQPEARPVSRPLSPATATPLNEHTANQLQARRIYSGAGIPGAGLFSSHSRSTSLSTHLEGPEGGLPAPPNSRRSSIVRPTGGSTRNTTLPDECILGTSRPPARMRSSSAWYIPQNLERLNNNPNQHKRRVSFATVDETIQNQRPLSLATDNHPVQNQRRVSFATIDIDIPNNAPPPIPPEPSFDIGARKSSESVASDAERMRRRSSVMSASLLAIQLDPARQLTTMGRGSRPTPVSMVGYDGEGYEAEAENKAPLLSVRKSRRRSSGAIPSPDNREAGKDGASPNMHSLGLRVRSRNISGAQPNVPAATGHLPEAVKWRPVFVSGCREMTTGANGNSISKVSPNNPVLAAATQNIHFQDEGSSTQLFPIDEIDSGGLTPSTAIATATAILPSTTTTRSASTSSFSTPIPEVLTFKNFTPGHFPENIDGITSCGSQGSSPARTIIRRNSWTRDPYDQDGDHASSPVEKILGQGGDGCSAAYVPAENEEQGEHDNSSSAGTISKTTTRNKGKSRAIDFGSVDEEHAYITGVATSRNRMVSASSTSTVIRVDHSFTDNSIKTHKPRPKKLKGEQGTAAISRAPPGNTTFNFPSNDRVSQLPVSFSPQSNTQGLDLNALNLYEREHLLYHPKVRELTQFTTQLPTLDQIRENETFDGLNADIGRDNPDEEVGFFKTTVQVIGVYFCYCFMTRKKKRVKKSYSGGRIPPLLEERSEYSSGEERVSNGERRAKMRTYGTLIERNFSGLAPARSSIDPLIPIDTYGHKPNHFTGIPSGSSLEGEIKPADNEDVPSRWVYHPAYEVDTEDAGDYAYLSEGSAPDATSVWRGHVRYRKLLAAQEAQRQEARLLRRTKQKAGKRQHRGRLQGDKIRVVSVATISGSILSVSTAPLFVESSRSESEHAGKGDSEFDGGDEADTAYTGDGATHSESIIGETGDESEDWESRSARSAWSFPDCGSFKQSHISPHAAPATPPRDIYSTISSVGSFCSNYFAGPIARRPSAIYNTVTKPCLSATLAPNGGTSFPAGRDGEGHGYLVQELRSALRNGVNACDSWGNNDKSIYPEGLPEGSMSSRATSYGSYLASTAGGAKGCFETNIRDFGATSTSSPLLPPVSSRKASRQPFSVIEVDTSIETYMHQKPPSVYRSTPESLKFHLENMKQAEVRAKVKKECKAGRGKLEGFYPGVIDGKKQALVKDFDGEQDSDVEEVLECDD